MEAGVGTTMQGKSELAGSMVRYQEGKLVTSTKS